MTARTFCLLHGADCDGQDEVHGQLEVADGDPCALCQEATRQWADLCDNCNDAFQDLADALDPA